ncbi:MAG: hypothetical protein P5702_00735 [Limnospira sp. PMC 1291.21]|uniref:Uncharacterized protein n=1 Tax=Limnospira fusiformis PMC 851.14 TaxID=2219512 RepID=A0ABU9EGX6_LIMFS|nr:MULTISPECIES: hypothetical protein [Limnospira]MDC0840112.1 hypothetical protein [Limnoraphis robusta]MDT9176170.1 hypothetical protein [Limnospira sp. PMC 1238.20]MDT9194961.1 hypothetical protein [Limnospira sp. PMC 1245.20]MDT9196514.1 hypothetical protein [Limnospira sp. PMC 1042.18]MDT9201600.1 hypothetical protein [Limnospira sp. PMC 1243.20]
MWRHIYANFYIIASLESDRFWRKCCLSLTATGLDTATQTLND